MSIVIETPKLLAVRITKLLPLAVKNTYVYTYDATIDVTAQLHSGTGGYNANQYDGRDINVGDYIATSGSGRILKISSITNVGPTRVECILLDEDQVNASVDNTQFGESSINKDDGILFQLREGKPYMFPLPDVLPGGLTNEFATQIISRFNFVSKEKNVNIELAPHSFELGETVSLTSTGWITDTTGPTGVVVKKDDDSFGVRLFGDKTALELPGAVGDVYYWDPLDRILTTTPNSTSSIKLFQKLDSREALLLDSPAASQSQQAGNFSGSYVDLTNKPTIPGDVSQLTDANGLLSHTTAFSGNYTDLTNKPAVFDGDWNTLANKPTIPGDVSDLTDTTSLLFSGNYTDLTNTPVLPTDVSDLTNDLGLATEAYVDQQVANIASGGSLDLSGYVTTAELNAGLDAIVHTSAFSGSYTDLTNTPSIPSISGLATESYVTTLLANYQPVVDLSSYVTSSQLTSALPDVSSFVTESAIDTKISTAIAAIVHTTAFSGDYDDLTNRPSIPAGFSGSYDDLTNKPTIPTAFSGEYDDLSNKPVLFDSDYSSLTNAPLLFSGSYTDLTNKPLVFSGDYTALYNKPVLPTLVSQLTNDSGFLTTITMSHVLTALGYTPANVANIFSGDYNALANLPILSGYQTASDVATAIANFLTEAQIDTKIAAAITGGTVNLAGYVTDAELTTAIAAIVHPTTAGLATETYVNTAISNASIASISALNDLNDVAIDGTETATHSLMYNSLSGMWENVDLTENWASKDYVTNQLLGLQTNGTIDLEGYASESWVTQKLVERGDHFSGNYNDLVNRPTMFSGDYNDLLNTPASQAANLTFTLSGNVLGLSNGNNVDLGALALDYNSFVNTPNLFSGNYNDLVNLPTLFSGNYIDLANKPYIPSIAGLATENYVDNKHAEPNITGNRNFTHNVEFRSEVKQIASTVDTQAERTSLVMAIQTIDSTETEVVFSDSTRITIAENSTAMVEVNVIGSSSIGQYGVKIKGIVHRTAAGLFLIGTTSKETLVEYSTWTANVNVDLTNLKITVVGSDATTVDWTVFCDIFSVIR